MNFIIFILIVIGVVLVFDDIFRRKEIRRNESEKEEYLKNLDIEKEDVKIPNYYLPYKLKRTMMSEHERLLFEGLRVVLGSKFDIYPQVNLDKIFCVERQKAYKYYLGWLRRINQKSVDFLVVKKETQSPVFAIELDDSTHEYEDRIDRDKFVGELFRRNNFPLVRFNPGQYNIEELKTVLNKYLENSNFVINSQQIQKSTV